MRKFVIAGLLSIACGPVWAYDCPADSTLCTYSVDTGSTPKVGLGGGGHTAHKREWIAAPADKYFVNATLSGNYDGRNNRCEFGGSEGAEKRLVTSGNTSVTVTFVKKYLIIAHSETGSGLQAIGRTAFMNCTFNAEITSIPAPSGSAAAKLDPKVRANVIELVRTQQARTFHQFQKNVGGISFSQAKAGIRRNLTKEEYDSAVAETKKFYDNLKVVSTIQIPTPDNSAVVSFDCVPLASQPSLTTSAHFDEKNLPPTDPEAPAKMHTNPTDAPRGTNDLPGPQPVLNPSVQIVRAPEPACPAQTVPIPRVSTAQALAPGFKSTIKEVVGSPILDINNYHSAKGLSLPPPTAAPMHRWAHAAFVVVNHGAAARLSVWSPRVISGDMSLSQIWVVAGKDDDRSLQTVEAGWQVMSLWQSPFSTPFVFSSSDDYGQESCYATKCATYQPPRAESFVIRTNKIVIGRPIAPQSVDGGAQKTIDIKWYRKPDTGDWWLQIDGDWVGYYPVSSFHEGPLSKHADYVDFGGETAGILPTSEMGSGHYANEGAGHAAFQSRLRYFNEMDQVVTPQVSPLVTAADCYTVVVDGPNEPETGAGKFLYFGGPGTGHFKSPAPPPGNESCHPVLTQ